MKYMIIILFSFAILTGCNTDNKTLEDAINNEVPYGIKELLHIEEVDNGAIVCI
ncbi:MAG: hypothetical protein LPK26_14075 [Bacillaceae bacterium]|nr:hypothetical protein [Bacillaceae bacterium]